MTAASPDIRWKQRLQNFTFAHSQLRAGVQTAMSRPLNELEQQGLIQAFEYTHELAWNVMKDYFEYQGTTSIRGSRDASREAFQKSLVSDGEVWMKMIESRNATTHTYNKSVAQQIVQRIVSEYAAAFEEFSATMRDLAEND